MQEIRSVRAKGEPLILCGHSLGGGYALVMATHLLATHLLDKGAVWADVTAVRTFGAPHALGVLHDESADRTLLERLHKISIHWVHEWDPVPRIPICHEWVIERLRQNLSTTAAAASFFLFGDQTWIEKTVNLALDDMKSLVDNYVVIGKVVLVSRTSRKCSAFCASESEDVQKLLDETSAGVAKLSMTELFDYHSMSHYLHIAHTLPSFSESQNGTGQLVLKILGARIESQTAKGWKLELSPLWVRLGSPAKTVQSCGEHMYAPVCGVTGWLD